MTNDLKTLREKVARAMMATRSDRVSFEDWPTADKTEARAYADAAISLIRSETLEEAARVAEKEDGWPEDTGSAPSSFIHEGRNIAAKEIASALRALKDKKP
jgi:hypothetical protein